MGGDIVEDDPDRDSGNPSYEATHTQSERKFPSVR